MKTKSMVYPGNFVNGRYLFLSEDNYICKVGSPLKGIREMQVLCNGQYISHKLKFKDERPALFFEKSFNPSDSDTIIVKISYDEDIVVMVEKKYEDVTCQILKRDNPKTKFTNLF